MKITRRRSIFVYIIFLLSVIGLVLFMYEFFINAGFWAIQPFNRHLFEGQSDGGKIFDRNGVILAQTKSGKRVYSDNADVRQAMLHTVGDGYTLIPTSVQSRYIQEILGYNFVTGLGAPKILSTNKNIKLNLDSSVCAKVYKSFKNMKGTAVAYNFKTGEVICLVSLPTYDVYNKPNFEDDEKNYEGVYINRALSSSFVPGSIFKLFTASAMINNIENPEKKFFECNKVKIYDGERVTCMNSHGKIDLQTGLAKSCDIVFGDIAVELGKEKMLSEIEKFFFNKQIHIDGISLCISKYDVTEASQADLAWSGIGQYKNLVNPMHMLIVMGAFANGGNAVRPSIVKEISSGGNLPVVFHGSSLFGKMVEYNTSEKIKTMMRNTMKNNYGDSMFPGMKICAKTGTGEVGEGKEPHGWMVGFSEDESFPFAFVVLVENGGFGIKSAGPIASLMMKEIKIKSR